MGRSGCPADRFRSWHHSCGVRREWRTFISLSPIRLGSSALWHVRHMHFPIDCSFAGPSSLGHTANEPTSGTYRPSGAVDWSATLDLGWRIQHVFVSKRRHLRPDDEALDADAQESSQFSSKCGFGLDGPRCADLGWFRGSDSRRTASECAESGRSFVQPGHSCLGQAPQESTTGPRESVGSVDW
jgi:hypothetical protein